MENKKSQSVHFLTALCLSSQTFLGWIQPLSFFPRTLVLVSAEEFPWQSTATPSQELGLQIGSCFSVSSTGRNGTSHKSLFMPTGLFSPQTLNSSVRIAMPRTFTCCWLVSFDLVGLFWAKPQVWGFFQSLLVIHWTSALIVVFFC